jgi:hypothetical protein
MTVGEGCQVALSDRSPNFGARFVRLICARRAHERGSAAWLSPGNLRAPS